MKFKEKRTLFCVLALCLIFMAGCETTKGMAKDTYNTYGFLKRIDNWLKENLW